MPATPRRGAGLTGGWAARPRQAPCSRSPAPRRRAWPTRPKADGTQAGYTTFAKGPFGGPSYVKKVTFGDQDRLRRGIQGATSSRARRRPGRSSSTAPPAHVLYRTSWSSTRTTPRAPSTTTTPAPPRAAPRASSPSGRTRSRPKGWVDPTGVAGTGRDDARQQRRHLRQLVQLPRARRQGAAAGLARPAASTTPTTNLAADEGRPPSRRRTREDLNPAATNLFFQHNRIHDEYYELGFTETAGNFQVDNGGKGGMGGDAIKGLVQAGAASGGSPDLHGARQRLHAHPRRRHPAVERHVPVGADQRRLRGSLLATATST